MVNNDRYLNVPVLLSMMFEQKNNLYSYFQTGQMA
ncbi:hypothetical protein FHS10_004580 [Mucilaginibacter dorajii]|nr:hypothetical protein [Mucilaginibacter dorajii]